jgi:lysophospholipase L1-like esterase
MSTSQVRKTRKSMQPLPQRIRKVLLALLLASGCASVPSGIAQTVYQPLMLPPANPAAFPAPRDDWYITVQEKFNRFSGKPADIVFDGDSITNRWETTGKATWSARYADRAADFGIEGDRIENLLWRLSKGQVTGINPKVVVLMIGTNNVGRNTPDQIAGGIKAAVAGYETLCPNAHIILMAVFPRGKTANDGNRLKLAAVNTQIAALDDGQRVSFVDIGSKLTEKDGEIIPEMMPDALHPTAQGYVIWADAIQPLIDKYVPLPR